MLILDNALEFHDQLLTSGTIVLSGFCSVANSKFVKNVAYSKRSGKTIVANPKAEYKNVLPVVRGVGGTVLLITSPRIHLPRQ